MRTRGQANLKTMNTGRTEDLQELYRLLEREPNAETRRNIRDTIQLVKGETGAIRSMREALVKAHRNGDTQEIKDIHDYIKGKQKYNR